MEVVVIGAGAIGSAIAAGIARNAGRVTIVARGARLAWLHEHPIAVDRGDEVQETSVLACDWDGWERPADMAILCTKTGDLADVLARLPRRLKPGAIVVTLQNGVEAHEQAALALPGSRIVAGRVHGFFEMAGQVVRHVGVTPSILLGGEPRAAAAAADVLSGAGFDAEITDDVQRALWEKMLITAGLGAVAAATGVPAGQVCTVCGGEVLLRRTLDEIVRVAAASGAALDDDAAERTVNFIRSFPQDATTSLQRDLAAGRRSEYDSLVAAVIRIAARHGIEVPTFTDLDSKIADDARLIRADQLLPM